MSDGKGHVVTLPMPVVLSTTPEKRHLLREEITVAMGGAVVVRDLERENAALRKLLDDAFTALDDIVDAEKADGNRNSYCAGVARGTARKIHEQLERLAQQRSGGTDG